MLDRHEPDSRFVDHLEWQIGSEIRRHDREAASRSTMRRLARAAALVVVSMAFGAVAMGASYQIEESWRKELLVAGLEVRLELAHLRIDTVAEELARVERQVELGVAAEQDRGQMRMYLIETEAQARTLELELEEIRTSGREPLGEVSSPLVGGRDFVSERLEVELEVARQRLELVNDDLQRRQRRYDLGLVDAQELEGMRFAAADYEERLASLENRLSIRQDFLEGNLAAVEAELLVLVRDAEQKQARAERQQELASGELDRIRTRVAVGTMDEVSARQVELMLAEVEAEARLARVELEVLQRALRERQAQR